MTNDDTLQQTVMAELEWNYAVPAANIVVTAKNGVVTLGGYVDSYAGKLEAQTAAARVRDVQSVANEIAVHLPLTITSSDEEIRVAAIDRLAWNSFIPKDSITVKVERRWVTLTGRVNAWYQKEAAARDIGSLKGIVGITDNIVIRSIVNTTTLGDDIYKALDRAPFFNSTDVFVSADLGDVTLIGSVTSSYERELAETIAWAAPGVTTVENDIAIG
jgi:osmotically-inducible protein OsmY